MKKQFLTTHLFGWRERSFGKERLLLWIYGVLPAAVILLSTGGVWAQSHQSHEEISANAISDEYSVRDPDSAIETVRKIILDSRLTIEKESVALAKITFDSTPYLHERIVGRVCWVVPVEGLSAVPKQTFDAFIDAADGRLLKIVSRWPKHVPRMAPLARPEDAEKEMWNVAQEVYHGFPRDSPKVLFAEALSKLHLSPLRTKQIIGRYVLCSTMGQPPRAVWAITLRGVPPISRTPRHLPRTATYQFRELIDASTGDWLRSSNIPHPDYAKLRATKAKPPRP